MKKKRKTAARVAGDPIALGAAMAAGKKVPPDVTELLMEDHRTVLGWFRWYEQARDRAVRDVLARRICAALRAHMAAEERWLYPAARDATGDEDLVERSIREHKGAKKLMAKLDSDSSDEAQGAIVEKLAEEIQSHVVEEETELFPKLRSAGIDLYELGRLVAAERAGQLYEAQGRTPPSGQREKLRRPRRAAASAARRPTA